KRPTKNASIAGVRDNRETTSRKVCPHSATINKGRPASSPKSRDLRSNDRSSRDHKSNNHNNHNSRKGRNRINGRLNALNLSGRTRTITITIRGSRVETIENEK